MVGLFLAVLLFLSAQGWAACTGSSDASCARSVSIQQLTNYTCADFSPSSCECKGENYAPTGNYQYSSGNTTRNCPGYTGSWNSSYQTQATIYTRCQRCDSKCDVDSIACEPPRRWVSGSNGECGHCEEPLDTNACDAARISCQNLGGKFDGIVKQVDGGSCCSFACNLCSTVGTENMYRANRATCCSMNMAPPGRARQCITPPPPVGCGASVSYYPDDNNIWDCSDPNISDYYTNLYFEQCNPDSINAPPPSYSSSSGSAPGSSGASAGGEGGSAGSAGGEGGSAGSAGGEGGSSGSAGGEGWDSSASGEGGDSSASVGSSASADESSSSWGFLSSSGDSGAGGDDDTTSAGCEECKWLDSILDTLTRLKWRSDDIYRCLTVPGFCPGLRAPADSIKKYLQHLIDSNVSSIRGLSDSNVKYLNMVASSMGIAKDSLAAHLDSILKHIPDSILDSIVKYQKYSTDRFDSVLLGSKGFSLVDSLIDSAVKYFQLSGHYDSVYRLMFSDSMAAIHGEFDGLPGRNASAIGSMLGYGDTASTNLRGDLAGIKGGIDSLVHLFGDTTGLGGGAGGYGDSLGAWRDSIAKYAYTDGKFDSAVSDTEAAWGVGNIDEQWDSSYSYGQCHGDDCPPCIDDSCMGTISGNFIRGADSIARVAGDSLEASTKRQRDSLPSFLDSSFAELRKYAWFGSFDSTFLANIGAKIPNTNTCPEHCFQMDVNGTYAYVGYNMHLDWKLCRPIAPDHLNTLNAFDLIKLLARILTIISCLYIIMWEVSSTRGRIGL